MRITEPFGLLKKQSSIMQNTSLDVASLAKELVLFTSRPNTVQRACFYCRHFQENVFQSIRKIVSLPISKTDDEWFFSRVDFDLLTTQQADEFYQSDFLTEYKARHERGMISWMKVCSDVHDAFANDRIKSSDRVRALKAYFTYPTEKDSYMYFALAVWSFDRMVVPVYTEALQSYFGDSFASAWEMITSQTELTEEQQMRLDLADLKQKHGEAISREILAAFQNQYRYLGIYAPEEYGFTIEMMEKMYMELNIEKTREIKTHIEHAQETFKKLLSTITDEKIRVMIEQLNYNVYFRTIRSERWSFGFAQITLMYDRLILDLNFTRDEIGNLTNEEIVAYFENGMVPPKRTERPALFFENGVPMILNEQQAQELKKIFSSTETVTELKGSVAFKGIVIGKAKVITSVNDLEKVENGDILISQFTRPEYLSAMQRAVAFVTNDGGITCHAAIIARELKKPCIVGTKIATKIFHDGDLVEVNADTGIVKLIEKAT